MGVGSRSSRRRGAACVVNRWMRGFTLLEVLIVMAIVGVLAGMATLTLSATAGRDLDQAAQRFEQVAALVRDEAMLLGQARAIGLASDGYAVLTLVELEPGRRSWVPLEMVTDDAGVLASHRLGDQGIVLEATLDGRRVRLDPADRGFDRHLLRVSAAGEFEPFELRFVRAGGGRGDERVVVVTLADQADRLTRATVSPGGLR